MVKEWYDNSSDGKSCQAVHIKLNSGNCSINYFFNLKVEVCVYL
jgi:hypothetical protein